MFREIERLFWYKKIIHQKDKTHNFSKFPFLSEHIASSITSILLTLKNVYSLVLVQHQGHFLRDIFFLLIYTEDTQQNFRWWSHKTYQKRTNDEELFHHFIVHKAMWKYHFLCQGINEKFKLSRGSKKFYFLQNLIGKVKNSIQH